MSINLEGFIEDVPTRTSNGTHQQTKTHPARASKTPQNVFYRTPSKEYLVRNNSHRWLTLNDGQFKRWLRSLGYSSKPREGESISDVEAVMLEIQDKHDIEFAGAVAGKKCGFYDENGVRFLVISEANLVEPIRGDWSTVKNLIEGLLAGGDDHDRTQIDTLHGWLKRAFESLYEGRHTHGQALALCGPPGSGKSCAQAVLLTPMLGGRAAKSARYQMGFTSFNADLCGCEHLVLDDEFMSSNMTHRMQLAANIKQMAVGTNLVSIHGKNKDAVNLRVQWRNSITVNNEAEAMMVLPPLDEHLSDKIILLNCHRFNFLMPMTTPEHKECFASQIKRELPAYAWWLMNDFQLPDELRDTRYGVKSFHHPDLIEALHGLSPEAHLLRLVDEVLFLSDVEWRGSADELKRLLTRSENTRKDAERLLGWSASTGTYLGRLAKMRDSRVTHVRTMHSREWIIRQSEAHRPQLAFE